MSRKIIKGDELQIWIGYNGTWLNPKWATAHTLTLTGNTNDISTKDHGYWGSSEIGKLTWEITAECLYTDNDFGTLFNWDITCKKLDVVFARVRNYDANGLTSVGGNVQAWEPTAKQLNGKCIITSLNANANTGENATYSITFTGCGALKSVDHSVTNTYLDVKYDIPSLQTNVYKIYNTLNGNDAVMSIVVFSEHSEGSWTIDHNGKIPEAIVTEIEDTIGDNELTVRYYLSGNIVPAHMFQNIYMMTFNGTFTDTVRVGEYAFASADVSDGVATITTAYGIYYGAHAFDNCASLYLLNGTVQSAVSALNGLDYGDYAFRNTEIQSVTHNTNYEPLEIGFGTFEGCSQLSDYHMTYNVNLVGQDAFKGCDGIIIHFYQQSAPTCSNNSFGTVGHQYFKLHDVTSVADFLGDEEMSVYYPAADCDYQLV